MPVRTSEATWKGDIQSGSGHMTIGDGLFQGTYSYASRFQEGEGTNPEELLAAAHAGCYAMALSKGLDEAGFEPREVWVTATVKLGDDGIEEIGLDIDAQVPDIDRETFLNIAETAKSNCPVSEALQAVPKLSMEASLI